MTHAAEPHPDPARPALVVTHGNTARKHRPLERSPYLIGRDRCCDLALVAPEVAAVHCVLSRGPSGWRVRDCGSRAGTHVNGRAVQDAPLSDGDVLQVGPFSFHAHLPAEPAPPMAIPVAAADKELPRLRRSRRKLARLALGLRRRLNQALRASADLARQSEALRQRQRECEQRVRRLEIAERELAADREALDRECAAFWAKAERWETEASRQVGAGERPAASGEKEHPLGHRSQELNHCADQLRRLREELDREKAALAEARAAFDAEKAAAETRLAAGRADLARMIGELRQVQQAVRERHAAGPCSQGEMVV
ncbi:MAG TPA: FHA domain-containing protein [Gemmataceae bacterium]|nr:FHA domain-containing protein [Gemmataceae bacterium]